MKQTRAPPQGLFWGCVDGEGNMLDPYYYMPSGQSMTQQWCQQGSVAITTSAYHAALNVSLPQPYNLTTSWVNSVANFDNVALSIWTLFQVRMSHGRGPDTKSSCTVWSAMIG
jgi:hypothetical protein